MTLLLFDFDGTITRKDSLAGFIQYAVGKPLYYAGLLKLSPLLVLYKLGFIPNYIAKQKLIAHFFKGWDSAYFKKLSDAYAIERIDKIIRPRAMEKIEWHKAKGHKIVVVTASMESWLKKWCEKNQLDLIGTRLEVKNGKLTGKFASKNCYGVEKVNRIKEHYNLKDFDEIHAFGDSRGDKEMLEIADHRHYRPFQ